MNQLGLFSTNTAWVLVDASFLAYRALHSVGHLEIGDVPTGVIFGFLKQFRSICESPQVNSNKVVLFFDSGTSFRKDAYDDYKKKRYNKRSDEEVEIASLMWDQVKVLREILFPALGVQCLSQEGLESDDLLAFASKQLKARKEKGVIITADGDLYQCINRHVHWFDPMRRVYHTTRSFKALYGISPKRWGEVKAIGGCSTDNVAGVVGVGEKTAVKYLLGDLPEHHQKHKDIVSKKGRKIRKRNRALVKLPHAKTEPFELKAPVYKADVFFKFCERYYLQTFLNKKNGWKMFFGNKRLRRRR